MLRRSTWSVVASFTIVLSMSSIATQGLATAAVTPEEPGSIVRLEPGKDPGGLIDALVDSGVPIDQIEYIEQLDAVVVDRATPLGAIERVAREVGGVDEVEQDAVASIVAVTPNDPYYPVNQWGHVLTNVDDAWEQTTGSADVVVAVLDTGVSAVPDLTGALLTGYDFVNDDADPVDDHGHGTQSATVIAARGNDGYGMAGICWSCTILPVKVLDASGSGSHSAIAAGIVWATDQGADIINLSLGGPSTTSTLDAAVAYAVERGVLVLAAAGNNGLVEDFYPAQTPGAVSVAGSRSDDTRYSWSNYGTAKVDIAAPGCNVAQAVDETFVWYCGTSSATPFTAGVAALALAADPSRTGADLVSALYDSTVPNDFTRYGRLDATAGLLAGAAQPDTVAPTATFTAPLPGRYLSGTVTVSATATDDRAVVRADLYVGGSFHATTTTEPWSLQVTTSDYPSGTTQLRWRVFDEAGNVGVVQRTVTFDNSAPTVSFVTPDPSQPVQGVVEVVASISDDTDIAYAQLYVNDTLVGLDWIEPYRLLVNTNTLDEGTHTLRWRAIDRTGKVGVVERSIVVDRARPTAAVQWPNPGRVVRGFVGVRTDIADGIGVATTELLVDGTAVDTRPGAPTIMTYDARGSAGRVELALRVTDKAGNVTTSPTRVVYVDETPPSIAFGAPYPSQQVSTSIQATASVDDTNGVARVLLYANGQFVGSATEAPWSVTFDPTGFTGTVTLRWVAFDKAFNRSTISRTVVVP